MSKKYPIRTCISCGAKRNKYQLIRLVLDERGYVVKDLKMVMPGRGAYICDKKECHRMLLKNKKLNKRFRQNREIKISPELEREIKNIINTL